jgi:hypothetical protein
VLSLVRAVVLVQTELGFPLEALEPLEVAEPIPPMPAPALPPYNGYGTLDDSKQNCIALVPKPPKKVCTLQSLCDTVCGSGAGALCVQYCRSTS